jgi:hypothetical protein
MEKEMNKPEEKKEINVYKPYSKISRYDWINNSKEIEKLRSEVNWYRSYGEFINENYINIDAQASSYADGDWEE